MMAKTQTSKVTLKDVLTYLKTATNEQAQRIAQEAANRVLDLEGP